MNYKLSLRKEAEFDLNEQFEYYEKIREGLGHDFLLCVESALEKLKRSPRIYPAVYKDLRRVPIRRFPHRIYYLVRHEKIIITSIFHVRKNPTSWDSRT